MKYWVFLALLLLMSCSSGGGGGGSSSGGGNSYEIALDQASLALTDSPYGDSVDSVNVTATFNGDGVIVGYPPHLTPVEWLTVDTLSSTSTSAQFRVSRNYAVSLTSGSHSTVLRFVTGNVNGGATKHVDLRVTLTIEEAFSVRTPLRPRVKNTIIDLTNKDLEFWLLGDDTNNLFPKEQVYFMVRGDRSVWTASEDASWLSLSSVSGNGPANVQLSVTTEGLSYGTYETEITVIDSYSGIRETLPVRFDFLQQHVGEVVDISDPWIFDFNVTDILIHESARKIYVTDKNAKKLFIVNSATGETEKYFEFELIPWRMALNPDNSALYIAILEEEHSPYYWLENQKGRVVIMDVASETITDEFRLYFAPGDLLVAENDRLLIGGGSGQHPPVVQYDAITGVFENTHIDSTSPVEKMEFLPNQNYFVYRSSWQSPPPVYKASLGAMRGLDEQFQHNHGDWESEIEFWIFPDGSHLLTSYGDVFSTLDTQVVTRITEPYVYLQAAVMNAASNRIIVLDSNGRLLEHNLNTFEELSVLAENVEAASAIYYLNQEYRALRMTGSGSALELLSW